MKDLLFAQKISHTWQNCITSSNRLQQGLFFRASGARPAIDPITEIFDATIQKDFKALNSSKDKFVDNTVVNPLFRKAFSPPRMVTRLLGLSQTFQIGAPFARPEASWRRMLWTYPEVEKSELASTKQKAHQVTDAFRNHSPFPRDPKERQDLDDVVIESLQRQFIKLFCLLEEPRSTSDLEARVSAENEA